MLRNLYVILEAIWHTIYLATPSLIVVGMALLVILGIIRQHEQRKAKKKEDRLV